MNVFAIAIERYDRLAPCSCGVVRSARRLAASASVRPVVVVSAASPVTVIDGS